MIRFILKGLIRDRSRSLLPILTVCCGAFLTVVLYSWMLGVIGELVHSNAQFDTGHVKIMTHAYAEIADQVPNDLALLEVNHLLDELHTHEKNMIWTPRIRFGGLLDVPDAHGETRDQGPIMGLGIDLFGEAYDKDILNLEKAIVEGNLPKTRNEVVISHDFSEKLDLSIGDMVTLIGSTMYGAMAMHNFKVSGTVRFGIAPMDRGAIIADITDVQNALDMNDGASEILGFSRDMVYSDSDMQHLAERFNSQFSQEEDEFSPVMLSLGQQGTLSEYLGYAGSMGAIMVLIFVVAMSIVLWNSGLMNGLRRYGEIGVRLAIGEPKGNLYRWMICESLITGLVGSIIGTAIGLGLSYYLQYTGFDISYATKQSTMLISNVIRAKVTYWSYMIGFVPGLGASVIGTMFAGIGIYRRQTSQLFKELEV